MMPSVISLISVSSADTSVNRTWYPTVSPSGLPSSSAIRSATVLAASRRGWVWPICPATPRPSSRQILGIWVVLPEPVSPAMITTWWSRMARAISSLRWLTGSSAGYEIGGMAARRAARAAERPERPARDRTDPAGEDVTEVDSIPAGRIDQAGPHRITVFRPATFRPGRPGLIVQAERERRLGRGFRQLVLISEPPDRGAGGQELGRVLAPDVVLDLHGHADDAGRLGCGRLGLHPRQRQLAGLVDALGELHHLLILADLAQRLQHALVCDVIHAGAEHEGDWHRAGRQQPEEVLRRQVGGEGAAVGSTVRAMAGPVADRGPGRHELQAVLAPGVHLHPQLHADDAVGSQVVGLGAHPGHGVLPGVVHGLGEDLQFLVPAPPADLQADVIDRGADDKAERLEAGLAEQHVLRCRQVRGEDAGRTGPGRLGEPTVGRLRLPHRRVLTLLI